MLKDGSFDGYIKNDHLICSEGIKSRVEPYVWSYLCKCSYSLKEPYFNKRKLDIPVGEPDHGILIGELELE